MTELEEGLQAANNGVSTALARIVQALHARGVLAKMAVLSGSVVAGLILGGLLILGSGVNPLLAYRTVFVGAFGSVYDLTETLVKSTPILLAALGVAVAFRSGVWNIGSEGQLQMGGLAVAALGLVFVDRNVPALVLVPLLILAGFLAGGAWAGIAGVLKVRWGVNEVICTIMMNFIAMLFVNYVISGPLRDPAGGGLPLTREIALTGRLPLLISRFLPDSRLHFGFLLGLIAVGGTYVLLWRTVPGFQIRAVGANPFAAKTGGIDVVRSILFALFISGGLAGIAGMSEVAGLHHRLIQGFSPGYGFTGIIVALLGKLNPFGILAASVLFGGLLIGMDSMTRAFQVPGSTVFVIQGVIVLCLLAGEQAARHWGWIE